VQNALPDILAVVQVALEGAISSANAQAALARGNLPQVSTPQLAVVGTVDMQLHADPA
jgi:GNAT acetyltransferase 2